MRKLLLGAFLFCLSPVTADPCGMVPPISLDDNSEIVRVGEQKTYVFYKDGVETVVIHPGFEGDVDEFGMLIPFPKPPALRKVSDKTFDHITTAIDPPTITYWLNRFKNRRRTVEFAVKSAPRPAPAMAKKEQQVTVLNEEAVGMYEIAVLEAGSAEALKLWMDEHGFRFPDGMESTCGDYIDDKWCFVAVKTRVGQKSGVDPKPGMRSTNPKKPKGQKFTGKVQAMGFRFPSKELEVPMRLSAFNGGDTHNIVYVLAEEPMRVSNLPKDLVKRQITGEKLYKNLTEGLPYKLMGGTEDDMSPNDWKRLEAQRDPVPRNGAAADLFASDLFVVSQGKLSHLSEEKEKSLLDIGERLGLRGGSLDQLHDKELAKDRAVMKEEALSQLKEMHFTVIDGEFDREVLARENIKFEPYQLQAKAENVEENFFWLAAQKLKTIFS